VCLQSECTCCHTSIDADKVMSSNLRSALRCKSNIPINDLHGVQALFVPEARRYHLQSTRGSVVCFGVICSCQLRSYSRSIPDKRLTVWIAMACCFLRVAVNFFRGLSERYDAGRELDEYQQCSISSFGCSGSMCLTSVTFHITVYAGPP
jgi:hypothetical protein